MEATICQSAVWERGPHIACNQAWACLPASLPAIQPACLPAHPSIDQGHARCPYLCVGLQVRRLAVALVRTFWGPGSRQHRELEERLGDERRWGLDDQLLAGAQAVLSLA